MSLENIKLTIGRSLVVHEDLSPLLSSDDLAQTSIYALVDVDLTTLIDQINSYPVEPDPSEPYLCDGSTNPQEVQCCDIFADMLAGLGDGKLVVGTSTVDLVIEGSDNSGTPPLPPSGDCCGAVSNLLATLADGKLVVDATNNLITV